MARNHKSWALIGLTSPSARVRSCNLAYGQKSVSIPSDNHFHVPINDLTKFQIHLTVLQYCDSCTSSLSQTWTMLCVTSQLEYGVHMSFHCLNNKRISQTVYSWMLRCFRVSSADLYRMFLFVLHDLLLSTLRPVLHSVLHPREGCMCCDNPVTIISASSNKLYNLLFRPPLH